MQMLHPQRWPRPRGFSHGVIADGRCVFVAGQIGADPESEALASGFAAQARQALANVVTVLKEAGAGPEHLVEMHWFVTDITAYRAAARDLGAAWRDLIGRHYPAITMVQVAALLDEDAMIEISATAVLPVG